MLAMRDSVAAADDQSRQSRRRLRPGLRAAHARARRKIDVALSNSFGFGGTNGTLVFRRF